MKKSIKFLEEIKSQKSKREYHIKYNYMKKEEIEKLLEKEKEEIKMKYDDEILKNSKLYKIEDIELLEIDKKYIIIRKDEKSFFFNKFILEINEYNKEKEEKEKLSLLNYMKKISNFIIIDELNFIILDIENDYIMK